MTSSGSSTNANLTQQNKLTLPISSAATSLAVAATSISTSAAPSSSSSSSNATTAILLGNVVHHGMSSNEPSLHVNNVQQLKMINQHGSVNVNVNNNTNASNNLSHQPILINQSNTGSSMTTTAAVNSNVNSNATVAVALASDGTAMPLKLSTLPNNLKINQLQPLSATNIIGSGLSQMSTTLANVNVTSGSTAASTTNSMSIVGAAGASSSPSNSNSSIASNASSVNTNTYGGFAHCSNCGEYGVKAAFYGKSKLYCSVACQNGIKKQQMQNQGVKRTAESLNYSPINNTSSSITTPPITLAPSTPNTTIMPNQTNSQSAIPTLIPINAHQLIQTNTMTNNILPGNIIITTGTPIASTTNVIANSDANTKLTTIVDQQPNKSTNSLNILNQKSQASETASSSIQQSLSNLVTVSATSNTPLQVSQVASQQPMKQIDTNLSIKTTTSTTNTQQTALSSSTIASSINSVIQNSADQNDINPRPVKRQRNSSVQSVSSVDSSTNSKNQDKHSTMNAKLSNSNQTNNKSSVLSTKTSVSPVNSTKRRNSSLSNAATTHQSSNAFSLHSYIEKEKFEAAPVSIFKHVPLSEFWKRIKCNMIVEVPNKDQPHGSIIEIENVNGGNGSSKLSNSKNSYWFASIVEYAGYLVKLRYIGYESESKADFWMHLCNKNIHSIGWAAENELPLIPPFSIINKTDDWKQYLIDKLTGFKTLPKNFHKLVEESLKSPFKKNMILELVDKKKLSRMRVARIIENIGGRLRMKYENSDEFDDFWCHQLSDIIHPVGWSITVGHDIFASDEYKAKSAIKYKTNNYESTECSPNMFKKPREIKTSRDSSTQFKVNMKLEAIDPLNLSSICVATIGKVLKNNYLMVKIDGYATQDGHDLFCYHRSSSSIFPAGFCQKNSLDLLPPYGYKTIFDWTTYLEETKSEFAPVELFYQDTHLQNPFKIGMKLESVDLMEPKLVCIATVVAVVNRLIRLNFDGWSREYDQWVDCESCDIYPIGWCQLVDYELQPPPPPSVESMETNGMSQQSRYNGAFWTPSTSSSMVKKKARKSTAGKKVKL